MNRSIFWLVWVVSTGSATGSDEFAGIRYYFAVAHAKPVLEFMQPEIQEQFDQGLACYHRQDWHRALDSFRNAQILSHRAYGVLNIVQLPVIDWMIELQARLGDHRSATKLQYMRKRILLQEFGWQSAEHLYAVIGLAVWHEASGHFMDAQFDFEEALEILDGLPVTDISERARRLGVRPILGEGDRVRQRLERQSDLISFSAFSPTGR